MSYKYVGEFTPLDDMHDACFVKASGQIIGIHLRHYVDVFGERQECEDSGVLVQWEPYGEARPLFTLTSEDGKPITLEPHITCLTCGDRGFIRDAKWVSMETFVPKQVHDLGPLAPVEWSEDEETQAVKAEQALATEGDMKKFHREMQEVRQRHKPVFDVATHEEAATDESDETLTEAARDRKREEKELLRALGESMKHEVTQRFTLKDSGERRGFDTGAVRDMSSGKGRYDLLQVLALKRIADIMEKGAQKYDARNWEKGMPLSVFIDSAFRHLCQYIEGKRDEDHLGQAAWNLLSAAQTEEMIERGILPESLNDLPNYVGPFKEEDD